MKNMKERFHKLITVILCFLVSMVPKRDEVDVSVIGQAVTASPVNGNAVGAATVSAENMDKDVNMWIVHNRKHHRMWKKLFFEYKKSTIEMIALSNETSGIRTPDNLIKSQVLYQLS